MIRYALVCDHEHPFEGWFSSSIDYDDQHGRGLLACPACGSAAVRKQVMAPAVAGTKARKAAPAADDPRAAAMQAMGELRRHVEDNFDYVGDRFADEARAIHQGRAEDRGVYGEASPAQVRELAEDGVRVALLPPRPKARSELN